jgi:pyridoxal/pyridoxine/pyridoxamine kinase
VSTPLLPQTYGGSSRANDWRAEVLDPVMGDQGRLYVSEGVVPVYKSLLSYADLIVPNQFETE